MSYLFRLPLIGRFGAFRHFVVYFPNCLDEMQFFTLLSFEISIILIVVRSLRSDSLTPDIILEAKQAGFSDRQIGSLVGESETRVRQTRDKLEIKPWVKQVCVCYKYQ